MTAVDLIDFVKARLDEDEAAANEVHLPRECGSVDRDGEFDPNPVWCCCGYPARVLREVAAKRAIVAARQTEQDHGFPGSGFTEGLEFALQCIAATWSDHADYRQDWSS